MAKKQYVSPSTVRLSGMENDYGLAIGAGVFWVIGTVFVKIVVALNFIYIVPR